MGIFFDLTGLQDPCEFKFFGSNLTFISKGYLYKMIDDGPMKKTITEKYVQLTVSEWKQLCQSKVSVPYILGRVTKTPSAHQQC